MSFSHLFCCVSFVSNEDQLTFGRLHLTALSTPGHTSGHVVYLLDVIGSSSSLFSGDLLFVGGAGDYHISFCYNLNGICQMWIHYHHHQSTWSLRSSSQANRLNVIRSRTSFGCRAFCHAAPTVWNCLPAVLTNNLSSLASFKRCLKTYLYRRSFNL